MEVHDGLGTLPVFPTPGNFLIMSLIMPLIVRYSSHSLTVSSCYETILIIIIPTATRSESFRIPEKDIDDVILATVMKNEQP